jgi:hypothetical protein
MFLHLLEGKIICDIERRQWRGGRREEGEVGEVDGVGEVEGTVAWVRP